jgi:hypothetical protein
MARRAGKHDGLNLVATALKREQKKQSKLAKQSSKKPAAAATIRRTNSDSSSESESDESMHNLEAPIPRKKGKKIQQVKHIDYSSTLETQEVIPIDEDEVASSSDERKMPAKPSKQKKSSKKKSIFEELMDIDTDDEIMQDSVANKATAEERAFLKAISQVEKKANKAHENSDEDSD